MRSQAGAMLPTRGVVRSLLVSAGVPGLNRAVDTVKQRPPRDARPQFAGWMVQRLNAFAPRLPANVDCWGSIGSRSQFIAVTPLDLCPIAQLV